MTQGAIKIHFIHLYLILNILEITAERILEILSEQGDLLNATHTRLCIPIIKRIYRKLSSGIIFSEIKVDGDIICDGHHRYVASILAEKPVQTVPYNRTKAMEVIEWDNVLFVEEDWDTEAKLEWLDEQDANFNNMSVAELAELLK